MGRNHFQKYHSNEGPIKRCLRCLINELKLKNDKLQDEITNLQDKNERLEDKVTYLKDELRLAQDRKEYYKSKYYKD